MTFQGTVKWFDPTKRFGFIQREGFDDIFVHVSQIRGAGPKELIAGDHVSYEIGHNHKGPAAVNVCIQISRNPKLETQNSKLRDGCNC